MTLSKFQLRKPEVKSDVNLENYITGFDLLRDRFPDPDDLSGAVAELPENFNYFRKIWPYDYELILLGKPYTVYVDFPDGLFTSQTYKKGENLINYYIHKDFKKILARQTKTYVVDLSDPAGILGKIFSEEEAPVVQKAPTPPRAPNARLLALREKSTRLGGVSYE